MTYEWGITFHAMPTDVVLGRETNPDGSVTRVSWLSDEGMARQVMRSPAPLSAIKGTKRLIRRLVGDVEVVE